MRIKYKKHESGGVLAFVAIVIFVIIALFALAIDLNMVAASGQQTKHFARFAALTGLDKYYSAQWCTQQGAETTVNNPDRVPCTNCQRYDFALARVNEMLDNQIMGDKSIVPEVIRSANTDNCTPVFGTGNTNSITPTNDTNIATLIPGTMSEDPAVCDNLYGEDRRLPCFVPLDALTPTGPGPSAFRVEGSQYRGLSTWFARNIFNFPNIDLPAQAVATLVPRHGCFIVDISASTVRDTHRKFSFSFSEYQTWIDGVPPTNEPYHFVYPISVGAPFPTVATGNDFSYYLKCPVEGDPAADYKNCFSEPGLVHPDDLHGMDYDGLNPSYNNWSNHDRTWSYLKRIYPERNNPFIPVIPGTEHRRHFADDYVFKKTYGDNNFVNVNNVSPGLHPDPNDTSDPANENFSTGTGSWFNLDMEYLNNSVLNAAGYKGPEPLRSILAAINTAMTRFNDRQVAGDQVCVIFYDAGVTWPRMFKMTNNFQAIRSALNFSDLNDPNLPIASDPEDINLNTQPNPTGILKLIRQGIFPGKNTDSYTNTLLALGLAYTELANAATSANIQSSDFVATISDGLVNCRTCTPPNGGPPLPPSCDAGDCTNNYGFYEQAMNDLNAIINNPNQSQIPIHTLLIGDSVKPHTLDIPDPDNPGQCLTDQQYRQLELSELPVRGNRPVPTSPAAWQASWNAASAGNPFYQANVNWYGASLITRGRWLPIRANPADCTLATLDLNGVPCDTTHFLPSGQRRVNDPFCRTQEQQMIDAIDEILGDNPFILVEP